MKIRVLGWTEGLLMVAMAGALGVLGFTLAIEAVPDAVRSLDPVSVMSAVFTVGMTGVSLLVLVFHPIHVVIEGDVATVLFVHGKRRVSRSTVRAVRKLVWRPGLFRPGKATLLVVVRTARLFPGLFAVIVPGELTEVNPLRPSEATDYRTALDEFVSRTPRSP